MSVKGGWIGLLKLKSASGGEGFSLGGRKGYFKGAGRRREQAVCSFFIENTSTRCGAVRKGLIFLLMATLVPSSGFGADGFVETVKWWKGVAANAAQYSLPLQNLYGETEAGMGQDKSRLPQAFYYKLNQKYPGSTYVGGVGGTFVLNSYTKMTFDSRWSITQIRQEIGGIEKIYDLQNSTLDVSNGPNRIRIRVAEGAPDRSSFTLVDIPSISATAHKIWALKGIREGVFQPLKDILNDTYSAKISPVDGTRMDKFAEEMVEKDPLRQYVMSLATELYSNRNEKVIEENRPGAGPLIRSAVLTPQSIIQPFFDSVKKLVFGFILIMLVMVVSAAFFNAKLGKRRKRLMGRGGTMTPPNPRGSQQFTFIRNLNVFYGGLRDLPPDSASVWATVDGFSTGGGQEVSWEHFEPFPRNNGAGDRPMPQDITHPPSPQDWSLELLAALEWKRFETVCAEYFRMIGYIPKETSIGPDGGVDVWLYKEGYEKPIGIVQCKAWKTYKVGVKPVRELFGVMAGEGVRLGKFITSGEFTREAEDFAQGKSLDLVSGKRFLELIQKLHVDKKKALLAVATEGDYLTPHAHGVA